MAVSCSTDCESSEERTPDYWASKLACQARVIFRTNQGGGTLALSLAIKCCAVASFKHSEDEGVTTAS